MSASGLTFSSHDVPPDSSVLALDAGLEQHNHSVAPVTDVKPLAIFANDSDSRMVGGALGRTWGKCCELQQLWVEPTRRASGVGSQLLQRFEDHAQARGCDVFYLTTLSFQAPEFYRKHGYTSRAEIAGYPNGVKKFFMYKAGA